MPTTDRPMPEGPFGTPTICDMNCFYPPGHDGPHQRWLGDPCDVEGCTNAARWRAGRLALCDTHRKWRRQEERELRGMV